MFGRKITTIDPLIGLVGTEDDRYGPFDLVVLANGTQSLLRPQLNISQRTTADPWGAVWCILPDPQRQFGSVLGQRYEGAWKMLGILPTGLNPDVQQSASLFWSLPTKQYRDWANRPLADWRRQVLALWPELAPQLAQITDPGQLRFAQYADVVMRRWTSGRVVVIGDAAHGMSPQLGQGSNMALWDAMVLADAVQENSDKVAATLDDYQRRRKHHLRLYQWASRALTPMFQSHSRSATMLRAIGFPVGRRIGPIYRRGLRTLAGLQTNLWLDRSLVTTDDLLAKLAAASRMPD